MLVNEGDVAWSPSITTSLSPGLFGECFDVGTVTSDVVPVVCSIILPSTLEVGSQPSFSFTLYDDDVSLTEGTSMLVAESRSVEWEVTGLSNLDESGSGTIQVRILNSGNTALSHQLVAETTKGLEALIQGDDIVNVVAGESQQFTVQIKGKSTGAQQLTLKLSGVQDVESSVKTLEIDVSVSSEESTSAGRTVIYTSAAIVLFVSVSAVLFILRSKGRSVVETPSQTVASSVGQQQAVTCWSCRSPILGPMQGCPGCGARYHADMPTCPRVENCTNCGASSEQFVSA